MRTPPRGAIPFAFLLLSPVLVAHDGDPKLLDKQPMYPGHGWRNAERRNPDGGVNGSQPAINFPSSNVTLLSWLAITDIGDPADGNGNSCYGYTSPSGREYAIIGLHTGTAFVEVSQPGNATFLSRVPGNGSLWRDVRTYSHYCYAVSEGGGGIQVMDLANIDLGIITLLPPISDDIIGATHTLCIDRDSGYLYRSGGGQGSVGLRIYDLNANPAVPTRVGTWGGRYSHEVSVFRYTSGPAAGREIAYVCGGLNGGMNSTGIYVVDVTNKIAPVQLQYVSYPNAQFAHQCWPSPDMQTMYLNDELDNLNQTRIFNIGNPLSVSYTGTVANPTSSVDHNLYTSGNRIYQANYRSGLRVKSMSNPGTPTAPVEIAYFDTWPEDDATQFNGLWNTYPYFASGTVIGSDIEKGLFAWWIGTPQITFQLPNGAPQVIDPAGETLRVQIGESSPGVLLPGSAKIHIDTGNGYSISALVPNGGEYDAVFPPTVCGTPISYFFSAESTNGVIWSEPREANEAPFTAIAGSGQSVIASDDFQTNQGWIATVAGATAGQWQRGVPVNDPNWAYDPPADADGSGQCFLTQNQAGNSDVDGGSVTLTSPNYDLTGAVEIRYSYWLALSVEDGTDRLLVEISDDGGGGWTTIATHATNGASAWRENVVGASTLASLGVAITPTMKIRFTATDGGAGTIVEAGVDAFGARDLVCSSGILMCSGDGTSGPCPCGNAGSPRRGCDNSSFTGGALLTGAGDGSVSADTLVLTSSAEKPTAFSLFLQGNQEIAPVNFGDGLRCAGGTLKRLYSRNAVGGTVTAPQGGDPSITQRSAALGDTIPANGTRIYHVYYRDSVANFCSDPLGSTFNVSNGLRVLWTP